ncbi:MAG TPA: cysteine rich repeat-containing protein, partial [Leptospiraceae bacterium]|nr:cysteine rich repeat-containing protein [Leptospiraceae bacterium]
VSLLPDCKVDQDKFCKDIPSPKAKITQCLLEHTNDLSESCKANLKDYVEKMRTQASGACKEDVNQFCKWVIPGGGRILKCLFKNESSLSASCKKILNE